MNETELKQAVSDIEDQIAQKRMPASMVFTKMRELIAAVFTPARVLTCVYCGHEYAQDTPAWGNSILTEHIRTCAAHPMRAVEAQRDKLHKALADMVGSADPKELKGMELAMRALPAPEADKAVSINAIHALLAVDASDIDGSKFIRVELDEKHHAVLALFAGKKDLSPQQILLQALRVYQLVELGHYMPNPEKQVSGKSSDAFVS